MGEADASPVDALEERVGHRFADRELAETALAHASWAHEAGQGRGNERLEFLGDAVLDLVVARMLYEAHPTWPEGDLTRTRAALVNGEALARCARELSLGGLLKLGRTEQRSGGAEKTSILANGFEAVLGALYLDGGLEPVEKLARRLFADPTRRGAERDPKTELQEWAHAELGATPKYRTVEDSGTEDDDRRFGVEVRIARETWGAGRGRTKRAAERDAAVEALLRVAARAGEGGPDG